MRHVLPALVAILAVLSAGPAWAETEPENYFQVVYDVTPQETPGFKPAFGYAVFVKYEGKTLLFDTGWEADILAANLKHAGIDLAKVDAVAISHNHPDHAGGLSVVRKARPELAVYAPPGQSLDGGPVERIEDQLALGPNLILLRTHTETPTVGIGDELSLLIKTAEGPYLITACSHTSVATIVDKAMQIAGRDIFFYTGGARLMMRDAADSKSVAKDLQARRVAHVSPGHCSVDHGVAEIMQSAFPTGYMASKLGAKVALTPPGAE